jgi:cytochrome c oxidase assembly protein subunit 17
MKTMIQIIVGKRQRSAEPANFTVASGVMMTVIPRQSTSKTTTMGNTQQTPKDEKKVQPKVGKSGKKICCSCPDTKSLRDACTLENGPESDLCKELIEKHKECLRGEGFIVK